MFKKFRITLIPLLIIYCVLSFGQQNSEKLRIITYNIWNGFDWGKDQDRRDRLIAWMKLQEPDVVVLQELCGYNQEKLLEDAKAWGHPYAVILKTDGYPVGLTSNNPIELKEKIFEGMHHGALHCKSHGIDFMVIHFSPSSYLKRREEAKIILKNLERIRQNTDKYVVLGDFNAHSPFDADLYQADGPLLTRLRKSNADKPVKGNLFNGNLDYAVLSSFLSFPLLDVCQPFTKGIAERGSFPGRVLGLVNNETDEELINRLERIDYILVSPELAKKCIYARVCNGKKNWYLSDHYPVVAEFTFIFIHY